MNHTTVVRIAGDPHRMHDGEYGTTFSKRLPLSVDWQTRRAMNREDGFDALVPLPCSVLAVRDPAEHANESIRLNPRHRVGGLGERYTDVIGVAVADRIHQVPSSDSRLFQPFATAFPPMASFGNQTRYRSPYHWRITLGTNQDS